MAGMDAEGRWGQSCEGGGSLTNRSWKASTVRRGPIGGADESVNATSSSGLHSTRPSQ